MTEPTDSKTTVVHGDSPNPGSPNPKLMLGSLFAALVGMGWAVLSAKKKVGGKPHDPAP